MRACEIAKTMSLFEIDEALDLLIESATEQAAEGEISDELRMALSEYVDALGEKVDRIANYIKAQEAFAEAAKKEASRLETRRRSADNRVKTCKGFVSWFMTCRSLKHLRGRMNTFAMANNSVDSLVIDDANVISAAFQSITLVLPWSDWQQLLSVVPLGPLHSKLVESEDGGKFVDRGRMVEALRSGQTVPGARLVRAQHVRLT
jgi:hypothetical protein